MCAFSNMSVKLWRVNLIQLLVCILMKMSKILYMGNSYKNLPLYNILNFYFLLLSWVLQIIVNRSILTQNLALVVFIKSISKFWAYYFVILKISAWFFPVYFKFFKLISEFSYFYNIVFYCIYYLIKSSSFKELYPLANK